MDTSTTILQVAVILMAARVMGELAVYLRMPSVIVDGSLYRFKRQPARATIPDSIPATTTR